MSFRGTFSALSINGFQSIVGPQWRLVDTKTFSFPIGQPVFSENGNYMAIYSVYDSNATGAVYIYYNGGSGTSWTLQQTIIGTSPNQEFGTGLSLNDDGTYLAIGAPGQTSQVGAVHIYTRSGTIWSFQQQFIASDGQIGDRFGQTVSLSGNATYLVSGAPQEDTTPFTQNGAAYVFIRSGTTWTQQQKLLSPVASRGNTDFFGSTLQISQDGSYLVVGAPLHDGGGPPSSNFGRAYIFIRSGTTWTLQSSFSGVGISNSEFGVTVNIDNTGTLVCIREEGSTLLYFYTRSGTTWTQTQVINYGAYAPTIINNSTNKGTAMQGTAINLIIGLFVNERTLAITNNSTSYQIDQELFSGITPVPQEFGTYVGIARTANVCAVTGAGATPSVYIYIKE